MNNNGFNNNGLGNSQPLGNQQPLGNPHIQTNRGSASTIPNNMPITPMQSIPQDPIGIIKGNDEGPAPFTATEKSISTHHHKILLAIFIGLFIIILIVGGYFYIKNSNEDLSAYINEIY